MRREKKEIKMREVQMENQMSIQFYYYSVS